MPTYKLTYFNVTGLGEVTRFLMNFGGVDFEDNRINIEDWPQLKSTFPMGQLPILEIDGKAYHQNRAFNRYLARKFNIYGSDELQSIEVDAAVDDIDDWRHAVVSFYFETDEALKSEFFQRAFEKTNFLFNKFEERVKKNGGYFVGNKMTWPDVYFAAVTEPLCFYLGKNVVDDYPALKKLNETVRAEPKIKAYIDKRPKTAW